MFPGIPGVTVGIGGAVRTRLRRVLGGDDRDALVEGLDAAAVRVDGGNRLLDLNPRAAALLGVERRAAVGRPLAEVLPAVAARSDPDGAVVGVDVDGDRRRMAVSVPVDADDGRWLVLRDVTDQDRYRRMVENVADPVYMTDDDGRIVAVSDAVVEQLGYERGTLLGAHLSEFVDEDAWAAGETALAEVLAAGGERATFEADAVTADGERRRFEDNVRVLRDDDGDLDGLVHSIRDVEPRRERERAFEQYETIVETVPVGVVVVDEDGAVVAGNERAASMLGYDLAALEGATVEDLKGRGVVGDGFPDLATVADTLLDADGRSYELTVRPADGGAERVVELQLALRPGEGFSGVIGVLQDATERRRRIEELEQYEAIMEVLPDPVYATDAEGRLTFVNRAFEEQLGYRPDGEGMHFSEFTTPGDTETILALLREMVDEGGPDRTAAEIAVVTSDGRQLRVEDSLALLPSDGRFRGSAGVLRDVTERKRRQEVLTVMNRALRHNLRTNVTTIVGYADLLDREVEGEAESFVQSIRDAADWLAKLGDTLRTLQRAIEANITGDVGVDVGDVVETVVESAREDHPAASLSVHLSTAGTVEAGWPVQYALENVVENAVVHSDRATPSVDVWVADAPRDGWVDIHVEDDGPGVPEAERDVVVGDAAITQLQHGSGIGLWLTRWLVEVFDGELVIEDNDPRGTVVTLRLPRSARG
jgi:PAS domain S-box-containing protein